LNQIRSQKEFKSFSDLYPSGSTPYKTFIKKEESRLLAESIGSLPVIYKTVIHLRHFEELSYKDISEVLDIDVNTVKSRLYTARMQLREKLYNR
jgi:RNA polymerase sigma-70 factor (ECF subfamily)